MHHYQCSNCAAALSIEAGQRTTSCPYCASPQVVERPPAADRPNPEFVLGFALARDPALELARRWLKRRSVFTVSGVKKASIESIRGVYLPVYLFSGTAHSRYGAQIGEKYTQKKKDKTVTRTEWRPLQGVRSEYVTDVLVTASAGIPNQELEAIEPFNLGALHRYSPAMISGWLAEEPSQSFDASLQLARQESLQLVGQNLTGFMPGDGGHRDLRYETRFQQESLVLALVPIWVMALRYDERKPPFRLLINGQTGRAYGKAPLSWLKIGLVVGLGLLAVLAVVAVLGLAMMISSQRGF